MTAAGAVNAANGVNWGDILTLLAVGVALGLGLLAFRQNIDMQKRQYRHKLLGEVVEWAIDIIKCDPALPFDLPRALPVEADEKADVEAKKEALKAREKAMRELLRHFADTFRRLQRSFQVVNARTEYVNAIASELPSDLQTEVKEVSDLLEGHMELLAQISIEGLKISKGNISQHQAWVEKTRLDLNAHWWPLRNKAGDLTKKAALIEAADKD